MSRSNNKHRWILLCAAILMGLGAAWVVLRRGPTSPDQQQTRAGTKAERSKTARAARTPPAAPPPSPSGLDVETVEEAYDLVGSGMLRIRCPHHDVLADDALVGRTPSAGADSERVYFLERVGDEVLAAVNTPEGGVILLDHRYQPAAKISWQGADEAGWGSCELEALEVTRVRGTLVWSDGSPAAGEQVVTCPGEVRRADEHGRFEFTIPTGVSCFPMGFVEGEDGSFGRGKPAGAVGGEVDEIVVTMPTEEQIWSLEQQRTLLGRLSTMLMDMEDSREDNLAEIGDMGEASPGAQELLRTWTAQAEAMRQARYDELEFLASPDAGPEEFVECWLNGVGM